MLFSLIILLILLIFLDYNNLSYNFNSFLFFFQIKNIIKIYQFPFFFLTAKSHRIATISNSSRYRITPFFEMTDQSAHSFPRQCARVFEIAMRTLTCPFRRCQRVRTLRSYGEGGVDDHCFFRPLFIRTERTG